MSLIYDARWIGEHGIGRFAREVRARLPVGTIDVPGHDPVSVHGLLELEAQTRLLHVPGQDQVFYSPGYAPPVSWRGPLVFTIHDLIHLDVAAETSRFKTLYYERVVRPAVRRSAAVVTVSEYSRQTVVDWSGVDPARVRVAYNGVDPAYHPGAKPHCPGYPYVLYVGNRKPHKNVPRLLAAFAQVSARHPEVRLVLSGPPDEETRHLALAHGIYPQLVFAGSIPEERLPGYYRGASVLALPSLYEGFGLPVLEAMACGTPVLTSTTTSLPEVAGGAARLVDPEDTEAIAAGLDELLGNAVLRGQLSALGLERARAFSWDRTAAVVREAIEQARQVGERRVSGTAGRPTRVFVQLAHGQDAGRWRERYGRGEVPDEVPYGYHHAAGPDLEVRFSRDAPEVPPLIFFRKALTRVLGSDPLHVWRNRAAYRWADVVWTHTEREHLAAAALIRALPTQERPHLVAQSIWLMDRWDRLPRWKKSVYRGLLEQADVLTFHSGEGAARARWLNLHPDIRVVPFGISRDSFPPQPIEDRDVRGRPLRLLAVGNDIHRDWVTLVEAVRGSPEVELHVLTGRKVETDRAPNIFLVRGATQREITDAYRWADAVAVPLLGNLHASGFTVTLEAIMAGKPVLLTRSGGLDSYFSEQEVSFLPVGDVTAWRATLGRLHAEYPEALERARNAQKRLLQLDLTTEGYAHRHVELTRELLARRGHGSQD